MDEMLSGVQEQVTPSQKRPKGRKEGSNGSETNGISKASRISREGRGIEESRLEGSKQPNSINEEKEGQLNTCTPQLRIMMFK
jgi:hypothetical protein